MRNQFTEDVKACMCETAVGSPSDFVHYIIPCKNGLTFSNVTNVPTLSSATLFRLAILSVVVA